MVPHRHFTIFALVIVLTQVIQINSRLTNHDPIVVSRYDFRRNDCFNKMFPNLKSSSLTLYRNENMTTCSPGLGIETRRSYNLMNGISSNLVDTGTATIEDFLEPFHNSNNGITIEIWMKPFHNYVEDDQVHPIITFGSSSEKDEQVDGLTDCAIQQIDLQVVQRRNYLEVLFRTADRYFEPCTYFRLVHMPINDGKINHLAIVLGNNEQQFFVNGRSSPILNEPFDDQLNHWNLNDKIYIFSYPRRDAIWHGRIYQILIHDGIQNGTTIRSRLAIDFPTSKPYALSKKIKMNEDAEIIPGSHPADWYLKAPEYQKGLIPEINLTTGSVNHEISSFLSNIGLIRDPPQQLSIHVTRLPSRGDLYQVMDGTKLSNSSNIPFHLNGQTVAFLPHHNEHSILPGATYTSFDYCVTDLPTYHISHCESETIFIVVDPVNDPPIPWANPEIVTVDESVSRDGRHVMELSGLDIDSGDSVGRIQIRETPLWGRLVLSVSSFREDGLLHGTLLSDLKNTISGPKAFVEYEFQGTNQVVQHGQVRDSFCFRVSDTMGVWSTEKCIWIHVTPSVAGIPQSTSIILEDSVGILQLRGTDNSGRRRPIGYIMESTLSESKGLLLSTENIRLGKGSVLEVVEEYPYLHGGSVIFLPSPDYCTDSSAPDDMLSYRVSAFVNGTVASISSSVNQSIRVECARDPLVLRGPETVYHVLPFDGALDDLCSAYTFNASEIQPERCTRAAIISGLQVTNRDRDTHKMLAHVTIAADNGALTLNRNYWDEILPIGGQEEARDNIQFLAPPERLDDILSYLHYQSDVPGKDEISVVICYGPCNRKETTPTRIHQTGADSQVLSHTISVVVTDPARHSHESYLFSGFQWIPVPFAIGVLLLIKLKGCAREEISRHDELRATPSVDQTCLPEETVTEISTTCSNDGKVAEEPEFLELPYSHDTDEARVEIRSDAPQS